MEGESKRVYVSNLAWTVAWQDLKDYMRQCGNVVYADVLKFDDSRSKGCGIVEYETAAEAAEAIRTLNNTEMNGRVIYIREDREDKAIVGNRSSDRGARRGGATGRGAPRGRGAGRGGLRVTVHNDESKATEPSCQVFIGNLAWSTSWQDLKDHFRTCGNVLRADVFLDESGRSRGSGTVLFETEAEAQAAIAQLNQSLLNERTISVRLYTPN